MRIHSKIAGIRGFASVYEDALRSRDMVTSSAEERVRILAFWRKHGEEAAKEAFRVSRATLFRWQKTLDASGGRIASLAPRSTAPKRKRWRVIPDAVKHLIIEERAHERIGKEKLARLLKDDGIAVLSPSTVGRMLSDLKGRGFLPDPQPLSFQGRTGTFIEKRAQKARKKLRSGGWEGKLAKADTIVRFTDGLKRYILTALDLESEFAFAYGYVSHQSVSAADFMAVFKTVAPVSLEAVQTDNGSEFEGHFHLYLARTGVVHFNSHPRSPKENAEIERFNRTLSEAFIAKNRFLLAHDLPEFNRRLMDWLLWYNARRPHWSLGLISPLRYICNQLTAEESQMCWTNTKSSQNFVFRVEYERRMVPMV